MVRALILMGVTRGFMLDWWRGVGWAGAWRMGMEIEDSSPLTL